MVQQPPPAFKLWRSFIAKYGGKGLSREELKAKYRELHPSNKKAPAKKGAKKAPVKKGAKKAPAKKEAPKKSPVKAKASPKKAGQGYVVVSLELDGAKISKYSVRAFDEKSKASSAYSKIVGKTPSGERSAIKKGKKLAVFSKVKCQ